MPAAWFPVDGEQQMFREMQIAAAEQVTGMAARPKVLELVPVLVAELGTQMPAHPLAESERLTGTP